MTLDAPVRLDRRQRKSRAALQSALVTLIARKPYADITIDDVVATADVARGTFYAHYADKAALLGAATQSLLDELAADVAAVAWVGAGSDWRFDGGGLIALLQHVDRNRALYRLVITGEGGSAPRSQVVTTLRRTAAGIFSAPDQAGRSPRQPLNRTVSAFVGALLAVVEDWIDGLIDVPLDELAVTFMHQQAGGLEWALGLEPGEIQYIPPGGSE
jgi:AcrR family transcriptional regulator